MPLTNKAADLEQTRLPTPKTLSLFLLPLAFCALMLPHPVSAGNCSVVRLIQSCDHTANADQLRQIRPGRSANARATIRMLRGQDHSNPPFKSAKRQGLSGEILIKPPDRRSADILARYGIPSFEGIPPIVIISPDEQDKKK
jgi:hypothetical protein